MVSVPGGYLKLPRESALVTKKRAKKGAKLKPARARSKMFDPDDDAPDLDPEGNPWPDIGVRPRPGGPYVPPFPPPDFEGMYPPGTITNYHPLTLAMIKAGIL